MILIGDIGNTQSKFAYYNKGSNKIFKLKNFNTSDIEKNKDFTKFINNTKFTNAVITSVVPKVFLKIKSVLKKKNIECYEILDKKLQNPIKIKIKKPKQLGSDRLANVFAANQLYKSNCIVIDFGTATTFDILSKNGIYNGGLITPGVRLSLSTLSSLTALLPLIKLKKTKQIIGKDTISAINSGVYWGYVAMIDGLLKKIISTTKKKYKVILTGGLAHIFSNSLQYKSTINTNITLHGVVEIIKYNKRLF
jgi:type III pantothenate kinase